MVEASSEAQHSDLKEQNSDCEGADTTMASPVAQPASNESVNSSRSQQCKAASIPCRIVGVGVVDEAAVKGKGMPISRPREHTISGPAVLHSLIIRPQDGLRQVEAPYVRADAGVQAHNPGSELVAEDHQAPSARKSVQSGPQCPITSPEVRASELLPESLKTRWAHGR